MSTRDKDRITVIKEMIEANRAKIGGGKAQIEINVSDSNINMKVTDISNRKI